MKRDVYRRCEVDGLTRANYQGLGFTRLDLWLRRNFPTVTDGRSWWEATVLGKRAVRHGYAVLEEDGYRILLVDKRQVERELRRNPWLVTGKVDCRVWVDSAEAARLLGMKERTARVYLNRKHVHGARVNGAGPLKVWKRKSVERLAAALTTRLVASPPEGYVTVKQLMLSGASRASIYRYVKNGLFNEVKIWQHGRWHSYYGPDAIRKIVRFRADWRRRMAAGIWQ